MPVKKNTEHCGHRERMRNKLLSFGEHIFDDYELLEMLLYSVLPYVDTNPLAKKLISSFGSLDGLFSASREEIVRVEGAGERVADLIISARELYRVMEKGEDAEKPKPFDDYVALGEYFVKYFADAREPMIALMLLDNSMLPIKTKIMYHKDYDNATVNPKPFIEEGIRANASVAVIAHTHPYGPLYPSGGDRATNTLLKGALSAVGIYLVEHYVVCGNDYVGFMKRTRIGLNQFTTVDKFFESKRGVKGVYADEL